MNDIPSVFAPDADRRKRNNDQHVRDPSLYEGQHVLLRETSVRGRNKIQDRWCSTLYKVLRAPAGGGAVYSIAPVDNMTKVRTVHRSLLKPVVGGDFPVAVPVSESLSSDPVSEEEASYSEDLFLRREAQPALPVNASSQSQPNTTGTQPPPVASGSLPLVPSSRQSREPPVRRTTRSTAGQHPNIYHLPQPAMGVTRRVASSSDHQSNSVSVLFRPWC